MDAPTDTPLPAFPATDHQAFARAVVAVALNAVRKARATTIGHSVLMDQDGTAFRVWCLADTHPAPPGTHRLFRVGAGDTLATVRDRAIAAFDAWHVDWDDHESPAARERQAACLVIFDSPVWREEFAQTTLPVSPLT